MSAFDDERADLFRAMESLPDDTEIPFTVATIRSLMETLLATEDRLNDLEERVHMLSGRDEVTLG